MGGGEEGEVHVVGGVCHKSAPKGKRWVEAWLSAGIQCGVCTVVKHCTPAPGLVHLTYLFIKFTHCLFFKSSREFMQGFPFTLSPQEQSSKISWAQVILGELRPSKSSPTP